MQIDLIIYLYTYFLHNYFIRIRLDQGSLSELTQMEMCNHTGWEYVMENQLKYKDYFYVYSTPVNLHVWQIAKSIETNVKQVSPTTRIKLCQSTESIITRWPSGRIARTVDSDLKPTVSATIYVIFFNLHRHLSD